MNKHIAVAGVVLAVAVGGYFYLSEASSSFNSGTRDTAKTSFVNEALAARFDYLSKNGNSSCAASFTDSIASQPDEARLRGSCCSPMSAHRYGEQVEGLKKFKLVPGQNIPMIPDDPYDVPAGLAQELMSYYNIELSAEEQTAYDYAMMHSSEQGPCCCKCWRWYVYGGLGKYLIRNHGFTGEQITALWDLSDGCGGENEHHH